MSENSGGKTTIRKTAADQYILKQLRELTGLKNSQIYRMGLRALLQRIKSGAAVK